MMASLVADYGESSHDSSETSDDDHNFDKSDDIGSNTRLPPPAFTDKIKNSVFVNPYLEAENAQFAVLEKHVKMVPQNNNTKSNKKVCWMFKKGKCRFGKKCKFSHLEENTIMAINLNHESKDNNQDNCIVDDTNRCFQENFSEEENNFIDNFDEDEINSKKRKKHPGLTRGLIPNKRVLKMYKKQKNDGN